MYASTDSVGSHTVVAAVSAMSTHPPHRQRRGRTPSAWRSLAVLLAVSVVGCSSDGGSVGDMSSGTTTASTAAPPPTGDRSLTEGAGCEQGCDPLRWAPPAHWQEYEVLELPHAGGRIQLEPDVDYQLSADRPIVGPLEIIGGRDIVWIGGRILIERAGELDRAIGLLVRDDDDSVERLVHFEGLLLGGSGLNDGINVDAPSAIVQVQNVHVALVSFGGADDRDGTGPYEGLGRNHPDVLQVYGGHLELRVDGLSATSAYQGLFLKVDHPDGGRGAVRLRRVDVSAVEETGLDGIEYAGNRMYFWDALTVGDQFIEAGTVWVSHHPNAGKVASAPNEREGSGGWFQGAYSDDGELMAEPPPGDAVPTDAVERLSSGERVVESRTGVDRHGFYVWWPESTSDDHSNVRNTAGDAPGRIHLGTPPDGPYVPYSSVGLGYRSPGYTEDSGGATG